MAILVVGATVGLAGVARADGGIPGSLAILLPADQPRKVGLATTFGLILSEDAGATWLWTCEQPATTSMANVYAVGPAAIASGGVGDRFYALSPFEGLAWSDDESCTWQTAAGLPAGAVVSDFFVDPSDPAHVLAVSVAPSDGGVAGAGGVFASTDGGKTFGPTPLYTAPAGAAIVGVEIARSDPRVIYVATYTTTAAGAAPVLARSSDGGATWNSTALGASVGAAVVRILAVDPQNSDVVYLRVLAAGGDGVAVARGGGATVAVPVTFARGQLSAFARLSSGTVLVGALIFTDAGGTEGVAVRSTDGGVSFQPWTTLPDPTHLVGLAERVENGRPRLYLSAKNYSDGWALAVSDDEGATLTKLMTYDQVKGPKACVRQICQDTCKFENMQGIWDLSVCTGTASGGSGGGGSGCGCRIDPTSARATRLAAAASAAFLCLLALARARRRRGS
ncbi:MAG TPA: sialidase family protein [Polyangia bacterium]|nr:sialidase family protein [Polyangia bacterium]